MNDTKSSTSNNLAAPAPRRNALGKVHLGVLLAFVLAIATIVGVRFAGGLSTTTKPVGDPVHVSGMAEYCGVTLQLTNGEDGDQYDKLIDEIAAKTSANTIAMVVFGYQENCASSSIFIDQRRTPGKAHLTRLIKHAQSKVLKVTLMPVVLLENPGQNEWRGKINPDTKWSSWWEDYDNFIMHYASIAQDTGVDILMVGSELISTEKKTEDWRSLIQQVRKVYKGRLAYSANWDHYKVPEFWDDLDIVGMTTYHELAGKDARPSVEDLKKKWAEIKSGILEWQAKVKRPIIFTEVAWPNQVSAAWEPWNYYRSPEKPDAELQARCFKAFFETWSNEPAVAGFLVWEWRQGPDQNVAPDKDTGYVPFGKPAMDVINECFKKAGQNHVATTAPASQPADAKPQVTVLEPE